MKVDGRPIFMVYEAKNLPNSRRTTDSWRNLARKAGFKDLYLVCVENDIWNPSEYGFDAVTPKSIHFARRSEGPLIGSLTRKVREILNYPTEVFSYKKAIPYFKIPEAVKAEVHPFVIPNWDNTPRCGLDGWVLHRSTPELFGRFLKETIGQVKDKPFDYKLVFVKSWNEWAEGNHLEPDFKYGKSYLEVLKKEVICDGNIK
jgi:hypothetical protein